MLIANEENSDVMGIGIDELEKRGELDFLERATVLAGQVFDSTQYCPVFFL